MAKIYESIKSLVTSDMLSSAAETLNEDKAKVSSAVSTLIPSLLGRMLKVGENERVTDIVRGAGKANLLPLAGDLFKGHGIVDGNNFGERMENALIGNNQKDFIRAISNKSGLAYESTDRLSNWVSGIIAGWFGNKVAHNKVGYKTLLNDLAGEKEMLKANIPADVYSSLGLAAAMGTHGSANMNNSNRPKRCAAPAPAAKPKKNNSWIWWLLIILLLLAICLLWWRSCDRNRTNDTARERTRTENTTSANNTAQRTNTNTNTDRNSGRESVVLTLPNGEKINAFRRGTEEQLMQFLKDDKYKSSNAESLRNIWFFFDNLDFKHDSANELESGSRPQIDNIARIMKNYSDAKIEIGGLADNTGGRAVNFEISKERAEYIKSELVKAGISANRISTEGFGKELATVPADASDARRAIDRGIALRFTK